MRLELFPRFKRSADDHDDDDGDKVPEAPLLPEIQLIDGWKGTLPEERASLAKKGRKIIHFLGRNSSQKTRDTSESAAPGMWKEEHSESAPRKPLAKKKNASLSSEFSPTGVWEGERRLAGEEELDVCLPRERGERGGGEQQAGFLAECLTRASATAAATATARKGETDGKVQRVIESTHWRLVM